MLGVRQVIICVNKIETISPEEQVNYCWIYSNLIMEEKTFLEMKIKLARMTHRIGFRENSVVIIPTSGRFNINIVPKTFHSPNKPRKVIFCNIEKPILELQ